MEMSDFKDIWKSKTKTLSVELNIDNKPTESTKATKYNFSSKGLLNLISKSANTMIEKTVSEKYKLVIRDMLPAIHGF